VNNLVKFIENEDGEKVEPFWHISAIYAGSPALMCSGEVYGYGEGDAVFEAKTVMRGGITCPDCLEMIKSIKSIKL
jgi:hypothetical protein